MTFTCVDQDKEPQGEKLAYRRIRIILIDMEEYEIQPSLPLFDLSNGDKKSEELRILSAIQVSDSMPMKCCA